MAKKRNHSLRARVATAVAHAQGTGKRRGHRAESRAREALSEMAGAARKAARHTPMSRR